MKTEIFNQIYEKYSREIDTINSRFPETTYSGRLFMEENEYGEVEEDKFIATSILYSDSIGCYVGNAYFIRFREDGIYYVRNSWQSDDYDNIIDDFDETKIESYEDLIKCLSEIEEAKV